MSTSFWIDLPLVTISSEPIPVGGATAANQVLEINALNSIIGNQTNGLQIVAVNNLPAVQAVSQDGAWSVGRTWALTFLTDKVDASGSVVSISNFPSTQNVNVTNSSLAVTGPLTDVQLRATPVPVSGSLTVSGTVTANQGTNPWLVNQPDRTTSGNITANGQSVSVSTSGMGSIAVQITGTWVGTLAFRASVNGSTFNGWFGFQENTGLPVSDTTSNALFLFPTQGIQTFEVIATAWTSGSASLAIGLNQAVGNPFTNGSFVDGTTGYLGVILEGGNVGQGTAAAASGAWPMYLTNSAGSANVSLTGTSLNANITNSLTVSGSGNFTIVQPTGTNLHAVLDSGTLTTLTSITNAVTVAQPTAANLNATVVGTVTANAGTNLNTSLLAKEASVANLSQVPGVSLLNVPGVLGTAWVSSAGNTVTAGNIAALNVNTSSQLLVDGSKVTQPVSISATVNTNVSQINGATPTMSVGNSGAGTQRVVLASDQPTINVAIAANQTVNVAQINGNTTLTGNGTTGTGSQRVTIASDNTAFAVNATLSAETTKVIGTVNQGTSPWVENVSQFGGSNISTGAGAGGAGIPRVTVSNDSSILGTKTNNNAAPGATNFGTIPVLANAVPPTWIEGNLVAHSADLSGNLRVYGHPTNALGYYQVTNSSGAYAGLSAQTPLFSMRWGDATRLAIILRVRVMVVTSTSASTAGIQQRDLIIARGFTASDTGGTAVTLTGNNQKRRTSMGTSLVTDMRYGNPLTAGTRTLDQRPIASAYGWSGLLSTGYVIGGTGSSAVGAARSTEGSQGWVDLLNAVNGQDYPVTLAQNEGVIVTIGKDNAQPSGATNQTFVDITWAEVAAY